MNKNERTALAVAVLLIAKSLQCCASDSEPCEHCNCELEECNPKTIMEIAADAIEELLTAVPHWVSVEKRLPETGVVVLLQINCEKARPHTGFLTVDGMFMHDVIGDMSRSKWKVTHWMPLPEPPKEVV